MLVHDNQRNLYLITLCKLIEVNTGHAVLRANHAEIPRPGIRYGQLTGMILYEYVDYKLV